MAQESSSLSTREFSELTGIAVSTVNRLLREGKIKGVKTAGKWKIDKSEMTAKAIQAILKPSRKGAAPGKIDRMAAKKDKAQGSEVPTGRFSAAADTKAISWNLSRRRSDLFRDRIQWLNLPDRIRRARIPEKRTFAGVQG